MTFRPLLSIYIHYPYCNQICSFCGFNKYKTPHLLDSQGLFSKYRTELSHNLRQYRDLGYKGIRSVYFGGGTPSLATKLVPEILEQISQEGFDLPADAEITLEANPTSLPDIGYLQNLGITRVSLGVQSLTSDSQLKAFNREHSTRQSIESLERLVRSRSLLSHGFSLDLMFGTPFNDPSSSSIRSIRRELELAIPYAIAGGHISLYELTLEQGTPLAKQVKSGLVVMPDEDYRADQYQTAVDFLTENGLSHYEVSSFALPGHYSRHNYSFWMHEDLIGVGPGAHGRVTKQGIKHRTRGIPDPKRWADQIELLGHGQMRCDSLQDSFAEECLAIGLRIEAGVSRSKFRDVTGLDLQNFLDMQRVRELEQAGLVVWREKGGLAPALPREYLESFKEGYIRASERGRSVLDLITPMLLKT